MDFLWKVTHSLLIDFVPASLQADAWYPVTESGCAIREEKNRWQ